MTPLLHAVVVIDEPLEILEAVYEPWGLIDKTLHYGFGSHSNNRWFGTPLCGCGKIAEFFRYLVTARHKFPKYACSKHKDKPYMCKD
jgi:hypothetical protein